MKRMARARAEARRWNRRNRILAAALGFVATTGAFGAFETFGNFALFGDETATGARPIVVEPKDGAYKSPTGRKAFLVAADDYGDAANPLPCAKNDVKALKARLESLGFTTVVLETGAGRQNEPTKAIIERRFKRFVADLREGDFALVYLSGHGLKPFDSEESFFAPVDVDLEDLFGSSVSINEMLDALKASDATFRWAIVDACRDDPLNPEGDSNASPIRSASKSFGAKALGQIASVPDSVALLQSCQPGKRSYEGGSEGAEDIENGFFTLSLLEALDANESKADANRDGVLTFSETFDYVSQRTNALATRCYGVRQEPNLTGSITNFALLDGLLIDGITKAKWDEADGFYREACALRLQKRWRDALTKIKKAREINEKREEYKTAEAEIQAQVDATDISEKRAEADKLAADAWTAFDLGGEANVEGAIKLMKESLKLADLAARRRVLKTFEDELEALRNPAPLADSSAVLYRRGRAAAFGLDGKIDATLGFALLSEAAENGLTDAKGALAVLYFDGCAATPPNFEEAFKLAKEASDAGNPWGQYVLGECYREGRGVAKDATRAEAEYKKARAGFAKRAAADPLASTYLGLCWYWGRGVVEYKDEATRRFQEAADAGLPLAAYRLGVCYQHGYGVTKDEVLAVEWYRKGAEAGNARAMLCLGFCYQTGIGVEKEPEKAFEWYQKGVEAGEAYAMHCLGFCYETGIGVEKEPKKAFEWYQKGAEAGDAYAMSNLGVCYEYGNGVTKNLDEAERWYRKAMETDPARKDFVERGLERVKAARATQN